MALRRRFGVLAWAAALVRPVRSRSVSSATPAAVSTNPSMACARIVSNRVMPVSLIARLSRASVPCAAAVIVTCRPASINPSMPVAARCSSPRYSAGAWAANAMRPGREASTVKLVSRHTSKSR